MPTLHYVLCGSTEPVMVVTSCFENAAQDYGEIYYIFRRYIEFRAQRVALQMGNKRSSCHGGYYRKLREGPERARTSVYEFQVCQRDA